MSLPSLSQPLVASIKVIPFPPFLFVIILEGLGINIKATIADGSLKGLSPHGITPPHICCGGKSHYGLAFRVILCMQMRSKESYFLPSSQT
jgi:hypothetical protein